MKSSLFRPPRRGAFLLPLALIFASGPVFTQQPVTSEVDSLKARIDAAVLSMGNSPRFKSLFPKDRQGLVGFVAGNMLFVLLHEMAHAVVAELSIPVLGRDEDAADSFAATRLIRLGNDFSEQIVADSAKGWFMSERRDKKTGQAVPYYDVHGLNLQRAHQFVCYLVSFNQDKFKSLADEVKLPRYRQESCTEDYNKALNCLDSLLKPHRRAADQQKTNIDVTYGDGCGK